MAKVLERLHVDHQRMGKVLHALKDLCAQDPEEIELDHLMCMLDYIAEYPDRVHHPLEDRLFARMLDGDLSSEARESIENNAASHEGLKAATQELVARVDALEGGMRSEDAAPLLEAIGSYVSQQFEHMNFEEDVVFQLAKAHISADEWRAIDDAFEASLDPAFDSNEQRYEAIFHYVLPEASYGDPVVKGPEQPVKVPPGFDPRVVQLADASNQSALWMDTVEALAEVAADQQRLFFEDASESFAQLLRGEPFWAFDHVQRRFKHTSAGFVRAGEILTGGVQRSSS